MMSLQHLIRHLPKNIWALNSYQCCCMSKSSDKRSRDELLRLEKRHQDKKWAKIDKFNKFSSNIGIANQMRLLELDGANDPNLAKRFGYGESYNMNDEDFNLLEEATESTKKFQRVLWGRRSSLPPAVLRRIITKKKFFPDPKSPNLLTWMEKETIRCLNEQDPSEWTPERLSECFPATPSVIRKVLKNRAYVGDVEKHDRDVRQNWKQLVRGKLSISPELQKHLQEQNVNIRDRIHRYISPEMYEKIQQKIISQRNPVAQLPQPKLTGFFGSILSNYNKRVLMLQPPVAPPIDEKKDDETQEVPQPALLQVDSHHPDAPTPYAQTALIGPTKDWRQEKPMTMNVFLSEILDKKASEEDEAGGHLSDDAKKFMDWYKKGDFKSQPSHVQPLSEQDIQEALKGKKGKDK